MAVPGWFSRSATASWRRLATMPPARPWSSPPCTTTTPAFRVSWCCGGADRERERGLAMDKFVITGPTALAGRVRASGAKNAALPALAASLLTDEPVRLHRVPKVRDLRTMARLLDPLGIESGEDPPPAAPATPGATAPAAEPAMVLRRARPNSPFDAPYDLVKTMRASVLV